MAYDTINTIPIGDSDFLTNLQTFLRQENADRAKSRIIHGVISGGIGDSTNSLTHTISGVVAYVDGHYVTQTAFDHTYTASKDTYVYLRANSTATFTTGNFGYTDESITYDGDFVFVETSTGSELAESPDGVLPLFKANTDATSILTITDYRCGAVSLNYWGSLKSAADGIGTTMKMTLHVDERMVVSTNTTLTSNIFLDFVGGNGLLQVTSGITLTINSPRHINASPVQQIFEGSGTIVFTNPGLVYPQWWDSDVGDGTTDCTAIFTKAIQTSVAKHMHLIPGTYPITDGFLDLTEDDDGYTITGAGRNSSIIQYSQNLTSDYMIRAVGVSATTGTQNHSRRHFFSNFQVDGGGYTGDAFVFTSANNVSLDNVLCASVGGYAIYAREWFDSQVFFCQFLDCGDSGRAEGAILLDALVQGYEDSGCNNIRFQSCQIERPSGWGLKLSHSRKNALVSTKLHGGTNSINNLEIHASRANYITACNITSATRHNIRLTSLSHGNVIIGNSITSAGQSGAGDSSGCGIKDHSFLQLVQSGVYTWAVSTGGTNEYYLEGTGTGTNPKICKPAAVYEYVSTATSFKMLKGTTGSLAVGEWTWANDPTAEWQTVYVRLTDEADPDSKSDGFIEAVGGKNVFDSNYFDNNARSAYWQVFSTTQNQGPYDNILGANCTFGVGEDSGYLATDYQELILRHDKTAIKNVIRLKSYAASPNDNAGCAIAFDFTNDASVTEEILTGASIQFIATDVSSGSEDTQIKGTGLIAGASKPLFKFGPTDCIFRCASADPGSDSVFANSVVFFLDEGSGTLKVRAGKADGSCVLGTVCSVSS